MIAGVRKLAVLRKICQSPAMNDQPGLRERKKQATREALRMAALRLAVLKGWDRVRVEDIAAEAGVSARTFNNYFASKEAALLATAYDRAARLVAGAVISATRVALEHWLRTESDLPFPPVLRDALERVAAGLPLAAERRS